MRLRRILWSVATCLAASYAAVNAQQGNGTTTAQPIANASPQAILAYWTEERMASAVAVQPTLVADPSSSVATRGIPAGDPGAVNGYVAGTGPYVERKLTFRRADLQAQSAPQTFGTAPTNPLSGPYGPFQRQAMQGAYVNFPQSVLGKLFFSLNGGNFVCSAQVIFRSTVATAGHCISDGSSTFGTNFLFCPSYNTGGINPNRGCWAYSSATTSTGWHVNGDPDYDYACIVTTTTGTLISNKIGNVTGWAGRTWNWVDVPDMSFGYPQGAPFAGNTIQQVASVDWYNWDPVPGGQVSKVMGNDMTGGSSGGGWFLGWRGPSGEIADTDTNNATDPLGAGPYINGVNSHKRCATNCSSPPTSTTGIFWQEMTSPPFMNTAAAGESEDVFAVCLAHANNNP